MRERCVLVQSSSLTATILNYTPLPVPLQRQEYLNYHYLCRTFVRYLYFRSVGLLRRTSMIGPN